MIFSRIFVLLSLAATLASAVPNPKPTAVPTGIQRRYLAVRQDNDDDDNDNDSSDSSDSDDLSDLSSALSNMNSESFSRALASLTEDPEISSLLEYYTKDGFKSSLISAVGSSSASEYLAQASQSVSEYRNGNDDDDDSTSRSSNRNSGNSVLPHLVGTTLFVGIAAGLFL